MSGPGTGYIQNFMTSRDNSANGNSYVGQVGRLWYAPDTNGIYVSDGTTPGGILVGGGASGNANILLVDGGSAHSTYVINQHINGGSAFSTF